MSKGSLKVFSHEEIKKATETATIVIISGKVYDVTKFQKYHPGGSHLLQDLKGNDMTMPFNVYHPEYVFKKLDSYCIGLAPPREESKMEKDFLAIMKKIRDSGLMKSDHTWYLMLVVRLSVMLVSSMVCVTYGQHLLVHLLGALIMGAFWQQVAFLGHDLGHNSVFSRREQNSLGGVFHVLFFGISGCWWRDNHNTHHITPNSVEYDPDVQYLPVLAPSDLQCNTFFSKYYKQAFEFDKLAKLIVSYQHFLFFPVLSIARFNLYGLSIAYLFFKVERVDKYVIMERIATFVFFAWYSYLVSFLPDWSTRIIFVLVSHMVVMILHVQLVLSHFAMEMYNGVKFSKPEDFITTQINSSMDVSCPTWMDWYHGGLQFQTTHHLLPRVPRHNLRFVRDSLIIPFCKEHSLQYHSYGYIKAHELVLTSLKNAALLARKQAKAELFQSPIWKMFSHFG